MRIPFVKMHGAGNDYVYLDGFAIALPPDPSRLAVRIADRHRGVGGDGLILVEPTSRAAARMRMFNADGSEAEMCGNGVRCVAHLVVSRGHAAEGTVPIETGRGVLSLEVHRESPTLSRVKVAMGRPILEAAEVPVSIPGEAVATVVGREIPGLVPGGDWQQAAGLDPRLWAVSMGNPHAIFFCLDVAAVPLETVGPAIETHPAFPQRTNVHFVQRLSRERVRMRSWERGSGITQACGTGASAVCVAGVLAGLTAEAITAELPGGELVLEWVERGEVFMTGPAEEVFEGVWIESDAGGKESPT